MTPEQREFLLSLDRDGELTADEVVEAARPPSSIIHDLLTWDNREAGDRYRLDEARALVRKIRVVIIPSTPTAHRVTLSEYVRTPLIGADEQGYTRLGLLMHDPARAEAALRSELRQVEGRVKRVRAIAARLELSDMCEEALTTMLTAGEATSVPDRRDRARRGKAG